MMAKRTSRENTTVVADWMSDVVLAVATCDSIGIARQLMAKHRVNQLPVVESDRVIGIVTDRDVRDAYPTSMMIDRGKEIDRFADSIRVDEVMSHNVFTVGPETSLGDAVELLRRHRIGSLPVVKNRKLIGIITRSDILDFVLSGARIKPPVEPMRKYRKAKIRQIKRGKSTLARVRGN